MHLMWLAAQDQPLEEVNEQIVKMKLDMVQLEGDEQPEYIRQLRAPAIKVPNQLQTTSVFPAFFSCWWIVRRHCMSLRIPTTMS